MKKLLYSLLIAMIFVVSICVLCACGEDESQDGLTQVNVKFMVGDTVVSEATYTEGDTVANPNIEEYDAYLITHWTVNGKSKNAFFPYKVGKVDLIFYAYTVQSIHASFFADGTEVQTGTYTTDDFITAPVSPTKAGYRFRYWALNNSEAIFPYTLQNETESRLRFEAVYEKLYTVKFVVDGKTVTNNEYVMGDLITFAPNPTKSNNTFIYWQDENGNRVDEGTHVSGDATFTALFEKDFYTATFYVGSSLSTYKVLNTSGKVLDLKYEGSGNFYGWYTNKNYTTKFDFSKPITSNVSIYGKVYSTDYEIVYSRGSSQKAPVDSSSFNSTYGFEATSYPSYITLTVGASNIKATYTFYENGTKLSIAYDMISKGEILCTYGSLSQIKMLVSKYNYSTINLDNHTTYDMKNGNGNVYYNEKLEAFGVYIAQIAQDYIQSIYDETKADGVITTGVADPDLDYALTVNATGDIITATTNLKFYSLKIQNSAGNYVHYSQNSTTATATGLASDTYTVIAVFENPYDGYVLRQIISYVVSVA